MLVYGHQEYQETLGAFAGRLKHLVTSTAWDSLDALRTLLIQAGQLEQGLCDCLSQPRPSDHHLIAAGTTLTDLAAAAFHSCWVATNAGASPLTNPSAEMVRALEILETTKELPLTIKIPEGFEFYALFPEQYCLSALRWAYSRAGTPRRALVVGIRSIGTTLSALVRASLRAAGWNARRITVRPHGHPFARQVRLTEPVTGYTSALVVDEGPGLSGSSMAATAQALADAGISDFAFLPGHPGEPGTAASPDVRRWWHNTPRFWNALEDLRWGGKTLSESLAGQSINLLPASARAASPALPAGENLSAGMWRKFSYSTETAWPAVSTTFERMKFRCMTDHGRAVLWKFVGFGSAWEGGVTSAQMALAGERLARPPAQNTSSEAAIAIAQPLSLAHGFASLPWIEGARLTRAPAAPPVFQKQLFEYIAQSLGPELQPTELLAGVERLKPMVIQNTREAMGGTWAQRAEAFCDFACPVEPLPAYTDGHLAPHEWVRAPDGTVWKTDHFGHDRDHTLVGKQSLLWDIAGALVEWGLNSQAAARAVAALRPAGLPIAPEYLHFHQLAYAAFRLGLTELSASQLAADDPEHARLKAASWQYARRLKRLLITL